MPPAPKGLGKHGRSAWRRVWKVGDGWLSSITDYEVVARLCSLYDERDTVAIEIKEKGRTARGSLGNTIGNPLVRQLREIDTEIRKVEAVCGFTPADRTRLALGEVKKLSKLEHLQQRVADRQRRAE